MAFKYSDDSPIIRIGLWPADNHMSNGGTFYKNNKPININGQLYWCSLFPINPNPDKPKLPVFDFCLKRVEDKPYNADAQTKEDIPF